MAIDRGIEQFTVSVTGEVTGQVWAGAFKVKTRMSHRDHMTQDRLRREYLGPLEGASPRAAASAEIFSQLAVRIVDAPSWWADNGAGLDLADDNVVSQVYEAAMKAEREAIEALKKAGEAAREELKKTAPSEG